MTDGDLSSRMLDIIRIADEYRDLKAVIDKAHSVEQWTGIVMVGGGLFAVGWIVSQNPEIGSVGGTFGGIAAISAFFYRRDMNAKAEAAHLKIMRLEEQLESWGVRLSHDGQMFKVSSDAGNWRNVWSEASYGSRPTGASGNPTEGH